MGKAHILPLAFLLLACSGVRTSGVSTGASDLTPFEGTVILSATGVPATAHELGIVQAVGSKPLDKIMPEFKQQVAQMGGNFAKVDDISTKYELKTQTQTYTYRCGNNNCTGIRNVTVQVATTQVVGRAFLVED